MAGNETQRQRPLPGWVPTRVADGSVRMRATGIDARSSAAKARGVRGAALDISGNLVSGTQAEDRVIGGEYDGEGRLVGGKVVAAGERVTPEATPSNIDRFKSGSLTPSLRTNPSWEAAAAAGRERDAENRATHATQVLRSRGEAGARKVGAARAAVRLEEMRRTGAPGYRTASSRDGDAIRDAGIKSRSPEGAGLDYSTETPYGRVSVRTGARPQAVAKAPSVPAAAGPAIPTTFEAPAPGPARVATATPASSLRGAFAGAPGSPPPGVAARPTPAQANQDSAFGRGVRAARDGFNDWKKRGLIATAR